MKFIPRNKWSTDHAKITFDKVEVSAGAGSMDASSGIFYCGQTGDQLMSFSLLMMF